MTTEERIKGRRIGIVGMARSGMAATKLALSMDGRPFVSDAASSEQLVHQIERLREDAIPFETGGHTEKLLDCDYLVLSPGVPLDTPLLMKAVERGIPMFSEIEFASWFCRSPIVAVTGSNGKTTTAELLGKIFSIAGYECRVCGNVGRPFSEVTRTIPPDGVAVVEVSTFQLEKIENFKPHVALLLNLTPDHLDRHGDFETYKNLKYRITENQQADDYLILNMDDPQIVGESITTRATKLFFSTDRQTEPGAFVRDGMLYSSFGGREEAIIAVPDILLPGPHNLQNVASAAVAAAALGVGAVSIAEALKTFRGVEHRLEPLGQVAGINFINDSKATNVESVCCALRSIDTPIYLIAGGRDKGSSYGPIIEHGRGKIKGITVIGEAQEKIFAELGRSFPVQLTESLEEAVMVSFRQAHPGETVLLSPGCASFDMFDSFEDRGQRFKEAVGALTNGQEKNETITS